MKLEKQLPYFRFRKEPSAMFAEEFLFGEFLFLVEMESDIKLERIEEMVRNFHDERSISEEDGFSLKDVWVLADDYLFRHRWSVQNNDEEPPANLEFVAKVWGLLTDLGWGE
ncbi:MAG: hypothetical protein GX573_26430 [Chloroflexi bacterium]|nr:hypothetical protein [Chloroflexota bacterium]